MPLYMFLHNLLNVLVQIANKTGLQKNLNEKSVICSNKCHACPSSADISKYIVTNEHSRNKIHTAGSEVLTEIIIQSPIFSDIMP
jgi:hypothetical protein